MWTRAWSWRCRQERSLAPTLAFWRCLCPKDRGYWRITSNFAGMLWTYWKSGLSSRMTCGDFQNPAAPHRRHLAPFPICIHIWSQSRYKISESKQVGFFGQILCGMAYSTYSLQFFWGDHAWYDRHLRDNCLDLATALGNEITASVTHKIE